MAKKTDIPRKTRRPGDRRKRGTGVARGAETGGDTLIEAYVDRVAERLLAAADPEAAGDDATTRVLAEGLAATARAERELALLRGKVAWLMERAVRDEVTDLLNHRGFMEALHRCLGRARRYGEPGALLFLDIDDYTTVLEAHGGTAGDYMLAAIANILRTRFREVDYMARIDTGRFAVLLTLADREDAKRRAGMLEDYLNGLVVPWRGCEIPVRTTMAITHFGQHDSTDDVVRRVEADLEARRPTVTPLRHPAE